MRVIGPYFTIGAIIAIIVLLLAILGMAGVLPFTAVWVFGLISALTLAILLASYRPAA